MQAGIEKNKDILNGFNSYKKFIDGLTEPEFLEDVAEEKKVMREQIKQNWVQRVRHDRWMDQIIFGFADTFPSEL